jgi:dethiobiotin synthetase
MAAPRRYLVTGTDTGVGKTTIACGLAFALCTRGMRVGVMKPVETGCQITGDTLQPSDALALAAASSSPHPLTLICPYRYRAALAPAAAAKRDGVEEPNIEEIARCFGQIAQQSDIILVEGAGGLAVPLTWHEDYAGLAQKLDLELVVVVPNRLGAINATMLTLDYAARRGVRVKGYILNQLDPGTSEAVETNADSIQQLTSATRLGAIGYKGPLDPAIVQHLLES